MAMDTIYFTIANEKRAPENDGYVAVISIGNPQMGDANYKVLDYGLFDDHEAAKAWFEDWKKTSRLVKVTH